MREPAFATWIVSLCPDRNVVSRHRDAALSTLTYYRYDGLRYSQFFAVESAAEQLRKSASASNPTPLLKSHQAQGGRAVPALFALDNSGGTPLPL